MCVFANETGNQTQYCCLSVTVQLKLICFIDFVLIDDKFGVFLFIKHEIENGLFTLKKLLTITFLSWINYMKSIIKNYKICTIFCSMIIILYESCQSCLKHFHSVDTFFFNLCWIKTVKLFCHFFLRHF